MRVVVSATGRDLDAQVSPNFGRCPFYVFVDTETLDFEAVPNPAIGASGGAGIQAAQFIASREAKAVLTGAVGPNAFAVLQAAGIPVFAVSGGTARAAVQAYRAAHLRPITNPTAEPYTGLGAGGPGRGRGWSRRGMGGWGRSGPGSRWSPSRPTTPPEPDEDLSSLKAQSEALREQLDQVLQRIEELEKR
jgi:predicted Fe-Mo cluster-binding NifX family protein